MTTPDRITTSTTSTPRHIPGPPLPPKRWYLRGDETERFLAILAAVVTGIIAAFLYVCFGTEPFVIRSFGVFAGFVGVYCVAFVRRGWFPPKGAVILGGDDE